MKNAFEKTGVGLAFAFFVDLVDAPCGPRVYRRIHITECPLVRRQLTIWVHVPLAQQQNELLLGEIRIDQGKRHAMESEIPRGVPRILPLVRHRDDVVVVKVLPLAVASAGSLGRRSWPNRITLQPGSEIVIVELLAPQQSAERLTHHLP